MEVNYIHGSFRKRFINLCFIISSDEILVSNESGEDADLPWGPKRYFSSVKVWVFL